MGAQSGPSNNHVIVVHRHKPQSQTVNAMQHFCGCGVEPLGLDTINMSFGRDFCTAIMARKLNI